MAIDLEGRFRFRASDDMFFDTSSHAWKYMKENNFSPEYIDQMEVILKQEGWKSVAKLPKGWLYSSLGKDNKYCNDKGDVMKLTEALNYMAANNKYRPEDMNNLMQFDSNDGNDDQTAVETSYNETNEQYHSEARMKDSRYGNVPRGWSVVLSKGGKKTRFMSPRGGNFASRRAIYKHMVEQGYSEKEIEESKECLKYDGWIEDPMLPSGWMTRQVPSGGSNGGLRRLFLTEKGIQLSSGEALSVVKQSNFFGMDVKTKFMRMVRSLKSSNFNLESSTASLEEIATTGEHLQKQGGVEEFMEQGVYKDEFMEQYSDNDMDMEYSADGEEYLENYPGNEEFMEEYEDEEYLDQPAVLDE